MTSEGDATLLKNNKNYGGEKKLLQASKGLGNWPGEVYTQAKCGKLTASAGAQLSQIPAVRTCFIFGPTIESRKPHLPTSFSFEILHSSVCLVEKVSIRDFLYLF